MNFEQKIMSMAHTLGNKGFRVHVNYVSINPVTDIDVINSVIIRLVDSVGNEDSYKVSNTKQGIVSYTRVIVS